MYLERDIADSLCIELRGWARGVLLRTLGDQAAEDADLCLVEAIRAYKVDETETVTEPRIARLKGFLRPRLQHLAIGLDRKRHGRKGSRRNDMNAGTTPMSQLEGYDPYDLHEIPQNRLELDESLQECISIVLRQPEPKTQAVIFICLITEASKEQAERIMSVVA